MPRDKESIPPSRRRALSVPRSTGCSRRRSAAIARGTSPRPSGATIRYLASIRTMLREPPQPRTRPKGLTGMVGEPGKSPELTAVDWPYGSATSMGYPGHSLAQPSGRLARRRYQPRAGVVDQRLLFPSDRFCRDRGSDLPPRPCYFSRNGGGTPRWRARPSGLGATYRGASPALAA